MATAQNSTTNPSTNFSYTNKDFTQVYTELLDIVKKLSTKWDPSISNESDPGVVLLKLNAIIADKNNYNIDRNILEFYPETASQEVNIRNIYKQLGYNMPWYISGTGTVTMNWVGTVGTGSVTIPKFLPISNEDKSIVYAVQDETSLPMSGESVEVVVRAGSPVGLTISGKSVITTSNLDSNNRIYISDTTAAQNGVFITSYRNGVAQGDYSSWKRVDNILMESLGTTCYEFGIDSNYGIPYLEFPSDIDTLIPEGMAITYLRSNGESDNITSWALNTFFEDNQFVYDNSGNSYDLSTSNIQFLNSSNIDTSFDPETHDQATKNYKKVLGTFDTLVTLRDYINEIYNSGLVSNDVVTDRTTDLQNGFSVVVNDGMQQKKATYTTDMTAFDLKLYALQYVGTPSNFDSYNRGFTLISSVEPNEAVLAYIEDKKSIQHDYMNLAENRICVLKNKYYIGCKIIPAQVLNIDQKKELINTIQSAIFKNLNAHAVNFGQYVDFQTVFNTISTSSEFIKSLSLDSLSYYTFASYFDDAGIYQEICVSDEHPYIEGYKDGNIMYKDSAHTSSYVGETGKLYLDMNTQDVYTFKSGSYVLVSDERGPFRNDIKQHCILAGCTNMYTIQTDFDYNIFQKFLSSLETQKADTNSIIELTTTESYTVHDNEVIQFYAPSLTDVTSYSTFVKYVFYSDIVDVLPANTNYTLSGNEWLVFFWKNTDSDLRYTYYKYSSGSIVFSNIDLAQDATAQAYVSGLSSNTEGKVIQTSVNNYLKQYQTGLLSSQSNVVIKKQSEVVLNASTNECYFITNSQVTENNIDYYTMFKEPKVNNVSMSWNGSTATVDTRTFFTYVNGANGTLPFNYNGILDSWRYLTSDMPDGLIDAGITLDNPIQNTAIIVPTSASTGQASISDQDELLTFLKSEGIQLTFTYTTEWPDEFIPAQYGLTLSGTWSNGDSITLALNTGIAVATTTSTTGYVEITDYQLLYDRLQAVNRRRTLTCTGTSTWDIDPFGVGIALTGTWVAGDTIVAYIRDEVLSVNFSSDLIDEYLLKSSEYFIFKDGTILRLYGSGTKITRRDILQNGIYQYPEAWLCPVISPELILEQGLNAIKTTDWLKFYNTSYNVVITEMQFINVLPGGTIQLAAYQDSDSLQEAHVVISNEGSSVLSTLVTDYTTSSAPYSVDIQQLLQNNVITEDGLYTFTPWVSESMGSIQFDVNNIGLENIKTLTYNGTTWDKDPASYGLTVSGTWVAGDEIIVAYTSTNPTVTVDTAGTGTAVISDEALLKSILSATIVDIEQLFKGVSSSGSHTFTYNGNNKWVFNDVEVGSDLTGYGIIYGGTPVNDDKIITTITRDASNNTFKMISSNTAVVLEVLGSTYGIESTNSPQTYNIYAEIDIQLTPEFNKANIVYQNVGDTTTIDLPVSTTDTGYEAISILNLNIGPSSPQQVYTNQTIVLYGEDLTATVHSDTDIINVVSNVNITAEGEKGIDLSIINPDLTISYPTISSYIIQQNKYAGYVSVSGKQTTMKLLPGETTYTFEINYPDGYYIMPLYNPNTLDSLKLYLDNDPTITIVGTGTATVDNPDLLFTKIIDTSSVILTYQSGTWSNGTETVTPASYGILINGSWANGNTITAALTETGTGIYYNTSGSNTVTIDNIDTYKAALDNYGNHKFTFDGSNWVLDNIIVSLATYGITATGTFAVGEYFIAKHMPVILNEIYSEDLTDFSVPGYYYVSVPCFDVAVDGQVAQGHTLRIVGNNTSTNTHSIRVDNLERIIDPSDYKDIKQLAEDVASYLASSGFKFDCTYQVNESKNISNPLSSLSFMNPDHLYNKFTICQAYGADIQLMS